MTAANFSEEKKLWRRGYKFVVGLDEAGRGPLAGPVCAAAVCVVTSFARNGRRLSSLSGTHPNPAPRSLIFSLLGRSKIKGSSRRPSLKKTPPVPLCCLRDSKQLTAKRREEWYDILTRHADIRWGVGIVSEKIIDKINIFEATKLAMKKAIDDLGVAADYLLLDGNFSIQIAQTHTNAPRRMVPCKSIIRGDEKVISCAAASIIAKVTRDRLMLKYHKKYPLYGFDKHKGYGTAKHLAAIKKYGPCAIHRRSFRPIVNSDWRIEISE